MLTCPKSKIIKGIKYTTFRISFLVIVTLGIPFSSDWSIFRQQISLYLIKIEQKKKDMYLFSSQNKYIILVYIHIQALYIVNKLQEHHTITYSIEQHKLLFILLEFALPPPLPLTEACRRGLDYLPGKVTSPTTPLTSLSYSYKKNSPLVIKL